jgi:ribosome-associated heat shock protein Hsp15
MPEAPARIRLDKWLWHARFAKSRSIAAGLVSGGHLRVNGQKAQKTAQPVGPGDVLTIALGAGVRVVRVLAIGVRRGPAPEAQTLYEDLTEPAAPGPAAPAQTAPVYENRHGDGGRPTKRDRRKIAAVRSGELE